MPRDTSAAAIVLYFLVVIPFPPRRFLVTTVLAAAMDPLALVATVALGNPTPDVSVWLWFLLPTAVASVLAIWSAARSPLPRPAPPTPRSEPGAAIDASMLPSTERRLEAHAGMCWKVVQEVLAEGNEADPSP